MNEIFEFVILALAVFRLSYMLVYEDGTFSIFFAIRLLGQVPEGTNLNRFQVWKESLSQDSYPIMITTNNLGKMLECIYCCSAIVGLLYYAAYMYFPENILFNILTYGLALSASSLFLNRHLGS